ncbi:MAG: hypothetical protein AB1644_06365 [Candidatus Zixiibacteriota bacterium]
MPRKQVTALFGAVLLLLGVFLPSLSFPIVGYRNYYEQAHWSGIILIAMALVSAAVALVRSYRLLYLTGGISFGVLLYTFIDVQSNLHDANKEIDLDNDLFKELAKVGWRSVQMEWGWAVLLIGTLLVLVAAAIQEEKLNSQVVKGDS